MRERVKRGYFIVYRRDWSGPWARAAFAALACAIVALQMWDLPSEGTFLVGSLAMVAVIAAALTSARALKTWFWVLGGINGVLGIPASWVLQTVTPRDSVGLWGGHALAFSVAATAVFFIFAWLLGGPRKGPWVTGHDGDDGDGPDTSGFTAPLSTPPDQLEAGAAASEPRDRHGT